MQHLCVSALKELSRKVAKLRNTYAAMYLYAGHSPVACFVIWFFDFSVLTKPQVRRFVIFSMLERQITKGRVLRNMLHQQSASTYLATPLFQTALNGLEWLPAFRVSPARSRPRSKWNNDLEPDMK